MTTQPPPIEITIPPLPGPDARLPEPPRPGAPCPQCGQGQLDYNGLLELECTQCGYTISGGACT